MKRLISATADNCGVSDKHRGPIHRVCQEENTFLIVRKSELQTVNLIDMGYPTKDMDIHDKSSNWGLTAGMVPVDAAFSKKKEGQPKTKPSELKVSPPAQDAKIAKVQLKFDTPEEFTTLLTKNFASTRVTDCGCGFSAEEYDHYHARGDANYCFLLRKDLSVFWAWRDGRPANKTADFPVPMYVWAYPVKGKLKAVTGDYDMWMVAPHVSRLNYSPAGPAIHSHDAGRGLSAATQFTLDLIPKLNDACPGDNQVFNHGAEAQNFSFTQELKDGETMAVFCPGAQRPFSIESKDVPRLVYDMLNFGYLATINPKWRHGHSLGAEDTAYQWEECLGVSREVQVLAGYFLRHKHNSQLSKTEETIRQREDTAARILQQAVRNRQARKGVDHQKLHDQHRPGTAFVAPPSTREVAKNQSLMEHKGMLEFAFKLFLAVEQEGNPETQSTALEKIKGQLGLDDKDARFLYDRARFMDHRNKMRIFRRIAEATGAKGKQGFYDEEAFPAACFSPLARLITQEQKDKNQERARTMALGQEEAFRRQGWTDYHGHMLPVDKSGASRKYRE